MRDDIAQLGAALEELRPMLSLRLVVGGTRGPELWTGRRTSLRERAVVWDEVIVVGEVALLDDVGRVAFRLAPLVRAHRPLPHGDLELFVIASAARGTARLEAPARGYELEDVDAGRLIDALVPHDTNRDRVEHDASPYPGLAPFGRTDGERYFGREREVEAIGNRLIRAPMIAVVGASGVGKSSFLHAGLAPRLHEYRVISMRPGHDSIGALTAAVERSFGADAAVTEETLVAHLDALGRLAPRGVVLIIDQLEELATLCTDIHRRERFEELLVGVGARPAGPVRVIVAVRDDFASMLESSESLRGRFEPFLLGAPPTEALRRILLEPARRAGYAFGRQKREVRADGHRADVGPVSGAPGRLYLPRDRRPVAEILADIDCRVPVRVRGAGLVDSRPTCTPPAPP